MCVLSMDHSHGIFVQWGHQAKQEGKQGLWVWSVGYGMDDFFFFKAAAYDEALAIFAHLASL